MTSDRARALVTVLGPLAVSDAGVMDAHQHVWIEPVPGARPGALLLSDASVAEQGLATYRAAGGGALVDCQPDGAGRNAAVLAALSRKSGVPVVACTGFHLRKYYPENHWLWLADETAAGDYFIRELEEGVSESPTDGPIRAGFIKIACGAELRDMPRTLLAAAATAGAMTGAALLVHTEQGAGATEILEQLARLDVRPDRVVLCHMDKRPDLGLHRELAGSGALLEYDTFFRPKYDPDRNAWPLVEQMLEAGHAQNIALGTDLADIASWRDPGPAGLPRRLMPRLVALGCAPDAVAALTGGNIAARLARAAGRRPHSDRAAVI